MYQPLADLIRPQTLDDVCGQTHILGPNGLLRRIIESGQIPNMIFYGPSGTGKTTIANIIAKQTQRKLCKLNATTASTADIKEIYAQLGTFLAPNGVLLYLDEIQYFFEKAAADAAGIHRKRQDHADRLHNGKSLFLCLQRDPLPVDGLRVQAHHGRRGAQGHQACRAFPRRKDGVTAVCENGALERIAQACGGDLRKAANAVELLFSAGRQPDGTVHLTLADATQLTQVSAMRYDRAGDDHYDDLSALMKSLRGSHPDAALHYLARFLESGDLPGACRRIFARPVKTSALPIHRPSPSSRRVSTPRCSSACPRRACRWPTRSSCSPPRRSPFGLYGHRRRAPMSKPAEPATSHVSCRTSTPTALDSSAIRAISIRTISPATG